MEGTILWQQIDENKGISVVRDVPFRLIHSVQSFHSPMTISDIWLRRDLTDALHRQAHHRNDHYIEPPHPLGIATFSSHSITDTSP